LLFPQRYLYPYEVTKFNRLYRCCIGPKAEILLAFRPATKAANMPDFRIWNRKKTHKYLCSLVAKITFKNSHLGIIKCPEVTLLLSKFFLGAAGG